MSRQVFFEDFEIGHKERFGRYEVTEQEIVEFAKKYDPQPYHVDEEAAKASLFGRLCASGWHTCAMTMRMMVDRMRETGSYSYGSPGIDEVRWLKPVFPGDVLSLEMEVVDKRRSRSRPRLGIVRIRYHVFNQQGEKVMSFIGNAFFPCREAADAQTRHDGREGHEARRPAGSPS